MRTVSDFVIDRLIAWDLHRFMAIREMGPAASTALGRAKRSPLDCSPGLATGNSAAQPVAA